MQIAIRLGYLEAFIKHSVILYEEIGMKENKSDAMKYFILATNNSSQKAMEMLLYICIFK